MSLGGEASFEWPNSCVGWLLAELIAFIQRNDLYTTLVDGCRLGMTNKRGEPVLKRWRFVTSSSRLGANMRRA